MKHLCSFLQHILQHSSIKMSKTYKFVCPFCFSQKQRNAKVRVCFGRDALWLVKFSWSANERAVWVFCASFKSKRRGSKIRMFFGIFSIFLQFPFKRGDSFLHGVSTIKTITEMQFMHFLKKCNLIPRPDNIGQNVHFSACFFLKISLLLLLR